MVEADGAVGWKVFQYVRSAVHANGTITVTAGGGGLGMRINRCSGAISDFSYQR